MKLLSELLEMARQPKAQPTAAEVSAAEEEIRAKFMKVFGIKSGQKFDRTGFGADDYDADRIDNAQREFLNQVVDAGWVAKAIAKYDTDGKLQDRLQRKVARQLGIPKELIEI